MKRPAAPTLLPLLLVAAHAAAVLRRQQRTRPSNLEGYSFAQYVKDFGRTYESGTAEYEHRASLFATSLDEVTAVNARNLREQRPWSAGIHPFMDWTHQERKALHGYKPSARRAVGARGSVAFLNVRSAGVSATERQRTERQRQRHAAALNASLREGGITADDAGPAVRNQLSCGSCWAISAVTAVEAQLARQGAGAIRLAAQALVDCVPNPRHCGGSGGCDGATGELAYEFIRDHGIPMERDLPYRAHTSACPAAGLVAQPGAAWPSTKRVRLSGWENLPSNREEPLRRALVEEGPVVVAVDGSEWMNYDSGIFDGCSKDATLGHAVLAKGFGEENGKKYWTIQNSWGMEWGENGHIRLMRHDNEEDWCGLDRKPQEGVGCDGGPPEVKVCGTCGILYDPLMPKGVRLEDAWRSGVHETIAKKVGLRAVSSTSTSSGGAAPTTFDSHEWSADAADNEEEMSDMVAKLR
eukprot:TRINITY_DN26519_c0_g1_i1.p1 TRINITY_DN26519_c0_g1~~TRINITY_DN26519_c0_g1_i1.p1  ORF type:complete len:469 (+),score=107.44 TRINITY_DN26519_c0_g1_i1:63-1469(+)